MTRFISVKNDVIQKNAAAQEQGTQTFELIGRRHLRSCNSWMHNSKRLTKGRSLCTLMMNTADAARLKLADGEQVLVTSRVGVVELPLERTEAVMPGVVCMPHGYGHNREGTEMRIAESNPGASINDLTDDKTIDKLTGNAAFSGQRVTVTKLVCQKGGRMMERQITQGTKIVLEPASESTVLTEPLFAINWFNTRANWLYSLYNVIAARSVFRVGAAVFFKGRVTETLFGSADASRQLLLIVNYPSGERFLDLLSNRYFQITSVLRMAAVRDFSFVLNTRVDGPTLMESRQQQFDASNGWAVHHYNSSQDMSEELEQLRKITAHSGIELHFASLRGALVHSEDGEAKRTAMNTITDRVVLLKANTPQQFKDAIRGPYSEFIDTVQNSYIGTLARVM